MAWNLVYNYANLCLGFAMEKKDPKSVDINLVDLERLKRNAAENPGLMSFAASAGSAPVAKNEVQVIKNRSRQSMLEQLDIQMAQIMQQIQLLAQQVEKLKLRRDISQRIYDSHIGFEPIVGKEYFLYDDGKNCSLSLISPEEWNSEQKKNEYVAQVRLLADKTWDVLQGQIDFK
jgi:hypothetical protein